MAGTSALKNLLNRASKNVPAAQPKGATGTKGVARVLFGGTDTINPNPSLGRSGRGAPAARTGESVLSSRPYSTSYASAVCLKMMDPSHAKFEMQVDRMLREEYQGQGHYGAEGVLIPLGLDYLPETARENPEFIEMKQMVLAGNEHGIDLDELTWIKKSFGAKAASGQSWIDSTLGGSMIGAPTQGEMIDLLRPRSPFGNAAWSAMPPTGVRFPRVTGAGDFSWANENQLVNTAVLSTDQLLLLPKKGIQIIRYPNEMLMYGSPSIDALFRAEMMKTVALGMAAGFLEGDGAGDRPLGILTQALLQTQGIENFGLNLVTSFSFSSPQNLMDFISQAEANNGEVTEWIGNPQFFWSILKQRWTPYSGGTNQGGFLYDFARAARDGFPDELVGRKFNKTTLVRTNLDNLEQPTTGGNYTWLAGIGMSDYWIGMLGAIQLDTTQGDTAFRQDQTLLRAKIFGNGAIRHGANLSVGLNITLP